MLSKKYWCGIYSFIYTFIVLGDFRDPPHTWPLYSRYTKNTLMDEPWLGNKISENHLCALPGPCMPSQQLWWLASARSSISKCFWLGPATEFRCLGLLKPYFIMCVWLLDTNITAKTQLELHVLYSSQHFCYLLYS